MERNKKMQIRLSPLERAGIKAKAEASGISASEFVRQAATRVKTWTLENRQVEQKKIREIARIGNNLNQLARAVNTQGVVSYELEILRKLAEIEEALSFALSEKSGV